MSYYILYICKNVFKLFRSQRVGIIGAIMLIKHIVNVSSDEARQSISESEENIPLSQKAKEAYSLIG